MKTSKECEENMNRRCQQNNQNKFRDTGKLSRVTPKDDDAL